MCVCVCVSLTSWQLAVVWAVAFEQIFVICDSLAPTAVDHLLSGIQVLCVCVYVCACVCV